MKKILATLLVLACVAPAMAVVDLGIVNDGGNAKVTINTNGDVVRGVALLVTCTNGASLVDLTYTANAAFNTFIDYAYANSGYAIGDGHPYALDGSAGPAAGGETTFVVSMGVLDQLGGQAGFNGAGDLITINTGAGDVCIALDTLRGGIVGDVALTVNIDPACATIDSGSPWTGDAASQLEWESVGSPEGWLSSVNARQCHGDADGLASGKNNWWVSTPDLNVLVAAWNKPYGDIAGQTFNGVPLINADFDHLPSGKQAWRVSTPDLNILVAHWNQNNAPAPTCVDATGDQPN